MIWHQQRVKLKPRPRGFHLVTDELTRELAPLPQMHTGLAHFFIQHTSASLTLNENADPTVRSDLEAYLNRTVPENAPYFQHTSEGPDDMPAHIKASLLGCSLTLPVHQGRLALGTWQGIYLGEHRNHAGSRQIMVTLQGQ